ncbi:iron-containing alcohol dehydrogenase [uncultured Metabacillus sp.]|uniref:iron-containing alcohol dehydrogenase n=1 Tax=uncultured Metabacillus sp. TaxID=2860135 RepID=UPI002603CBF3|nr:iron-containing alcohol dehydrogenase [uncultured Metabacillus sp.]
MNNLYQFFTAKHIISGAGSLDQLSEHLHLVNKKIASAFIVAQPALQRLGFIEKVENQLAEKGINTFTINKIMPEPTIQNIEDVYREIAEKEFDLLIGIGGGSVLDATKLLSVLKTNDVSIRDLLSGNQIERKGIPTILIPSTSGTGSEVTPNSIVTIPEEELKVGIVSKYLLPELVILDPVLTLSLPKSITAATGMDAFTHSLESFISNKANPISDMFALESIRLISSSLLEAYHNGSSIEAREKMLIGSMYGGMALTSAGTAAVHALAYPLGGKFNIPHGEANSMLLPHVMEFNMDVITERLVQVSKAMGIDHSEESKEKIAEKVIEQIEEWTKELNISQNLNEFGVHESDIPHLAESASKVTRLLNNNPKQLTIEQMKIIYRKLLP